MSSVQQSDFTHIQVERRHGIRGDILREILYPAETRLPLGHPPAVEKAFLSAQKVKAIDANAFGVMVGRVIDEVCAEKQANGEFLVDRLRDLANRGETPEKLAGGCGRTEKAPQRGSSCRLLQRPKPSSVRLRTAGLLLSRCVARITFL